MISVYMEKIALSKQSVTISAPSVNLKLGMIDSGCSKLLADPNRFIK
jgi:hypothetical protein